MFELHINQDTISDASTSVSWCVDKELLSFLAESKIMDPQVVICVSPDEYHPNKEYRKVVPLKDLIAYVELHKAGKNKIWAFVSEYSRNKTRDMYLTKTSGTYDTSLLNSTGSDWKYTIQFSARKTLFSEPIEIDVPSGAFAKEPPQWEKDWVNHFFKTKVDNQCDYRRRQLFAYTIQPILMMFNMIFRIMLFLIAFSWLSRGMSIKYFLHPLQYGLDDCLKMWHGGSWAIRDTDRNIEDGEGRYLLARGWSLPLMPIILLPAYGLACAFRANTPETFKVMGLILLSLLIAAVVIGTIIFIGNQMYNNIFDWCYNKFFADKQTWYLDEEEQNLLICNGNKSPLTMKTLPFKKKTIKLRFNDLKSKICKPFSR